MLRNWSVRRWLCASTENHGPWIDKLMQFFRLFPVLILQYERVQLVWLRYHLWPYRFHPDQIWGNNQKEKWNERQVAKITHQRSCLSYFFLLSHKPHTYNKPYTFISISVFTLDRNWFASNSQYSLYICIYSKNFCWHWLGIAVGMHHKNMHKHFHFNFHSVRIIFIWIYHRSDSKAQIVQSTINKRTTEHTMENGKSECTAE